MVTELSFGPYCFGVTGGGTVVDVGFGPGVDVGIGITGIFDGPGVDVGVTTYIGFGLGNGVTQPATITVANTLKPIDIINNCFNNCFFIVTFSGNFSPSEGFSLKIKLWRFDLKRVRISVLRNRFSIISPCD